MKVKVCFIMSEVYTDRNSMHCTTLSEMLTK